VLLPALAGVNALIDLDGVGFLGVVVVATDIEQPVALAVQKRAVA
jgi:hypothetical protein